MIKRQHHKSKKRKKYCSNSVAPYEKDRNRDFLVQREIEKRKKRRAARKSEEAGSTMVE